MIEHDDFPKMKGLPSLMQILRTVANIGEVVICLTTQTLGRVYQSTIRSNENRALLGTVSKLGPQGLSKEYLKVGPIWGLFQIGAYLGTSSN